MKTYELNGLGPNWVYEAKDEAQATKIYLKDIGGFSTLKQYEKYCKEEGQYPILEWREVWECLDCGRKDCATMIGEICQACYDSQITDYEQEQQDA